MTSSWLDNLAAHCEEEDEEDYESQPQLKQPQQQSQQQSQQQPQQQKQEAQQPHQAQSQLQDTQHQPSNQSQSQQQPLQPDLQIKSQEEKSNQSITTEKEERIKNDPKNEPTKDKEISTNNTKADQNNKKAAYSNTITKEMYKFDKSINYLLKRQEFYYAGSMIKTRSSVDFALERTSKPIQTIGGLGTVSLEAKGKYDTLNKRIMNIRPLCTVTPKSK